MEKQQILRPKILVLGFLFLLLLVLGSTQVLNFDTYEKFELEGESISNGTERVYAECRCLGQLTVDESYPPSYSCVGIETCQETNYTR